MKILVAGGAGYIGSVLIPMLLGRGYEVDVVELFWFGNHLPEAVGVVHKDIFNLSVQDLQGYEQVVFLAGLSNDPMAEFCPSKNFIFNAAAPAYLAYIAKRAGVKRYVYASSCSVYGYTENELYDETCPAICNYPYGISKLQGEQAVLQLADNSFSVIALRKGTVSGYSPRMRLDLIVNTMFKTAMRDRKITVNNPSIWRPILSIRDASTAYVRAVEANYKISGVFNIASSNLRDGRSTCRSSTFKTSETIKYRSRRRRTYLAFIRKMASILSSPIFDKTNRSSPTGTTACIIISKNLRSRRLW